MNKKVLRTAILLLLVGGLAGGIIAYRMYNMPHKDFANAQPDFELSAQELFDAFSTDEAKATQTYVADDKIIRVSGVLMSYTQDSDSTAVVDIAASAEGPAIVNCSLSVIPENAAAMQVGSPVVLQGQCTGYQDLIDAAVMMIRCGVVN